VQYPYKTTIIQKNDRDKKQQLGLVMSY